MSRLRQSLDAARAQKRLAFLPFLAGGYPDRATFIETLKQIAAAGADAVEIGFPFSDPIADGPVIQAAFADTLSRGFRVADLFAAIGEARQSIQTPLVAMVSYSVVYRYGVDHFLADGKAVGLDAILIPDLPPPEAQSVCATIRSAGLDTVLLVAPTTSQARRAEIAKLCSGFVYYLSVSGITGARDALPADLEQNVIGLKSIIDVPVCVGFGLHKPEQMKQLMAIADGAIVGSAIVKLMDLHRGKSPKDVAESVASYCREMICAGQASSQ